MSNLVLNPKWNSNINQVENGELISGGPDGNANLATKQLAENIWFLKDKVENDLATKADKSDVYTKNQTDNLVNSKTGDLGTLKTTDKTQLVKSINEVFDNTKGVVDLYNKNVTAGAGANGWTADLVEYSGLTQKQINNGLESVAQLADIVNPQDDMRVYVKSYHNSLNAGGDVFTLIDTAQVVDNGIVFASQDASKKWVRAEQTYLTPDMFGAKPNDPSFDNTDALNRAFATGRNIYGKKDDVYYVNGILNTKGQLLVGGWKISTSRYNLGVVNTDNYAPSTDTYIRMIYLETAYDLVELLHIKALGYNMINHYGYFKNISHDADGTFDKLLDNCKTAGLKVNIGTESDEAKASLDNFVKKYQGHPNVWGFASFDEGPQRGFTIADQDNRITAIKNHTKKPVTIVDFVSNPFKQMFSENHDYVFVNSYSCVHAGLTDVNSKVNADLSNMRLHYGCCKGQTKCKNVIPTLGLFTYKPEANYYANDIEQIILAGREFAKSGNGNYAVFVWDGSGDISITSNVRNNQKLKEFSLELSQFNANQPKYETDVLLFGGSSETWVHPITDLFNLLPTVDKNTTELHVASNAYPMVIRPSQTSTETERFHLVNNSSYYGIGMKGDYCAILLNQKVRKYTRCKLDYSHLLENVSGYFELLDTDDNGYTPKLIFQDGFTSNKVFDFLSSSATPDSHLILRMIFNGDTASATHYRKFLYGLIVCSDW